MKFLECNSFDQSNQADHCLLYIGQIYKGISEIFIFHLNLLTVYLSDYNYRI